MSQAARQPEPGPAPTSGATVALRLTSVAGGTGVVLPDEILRGLHAADGDVVRLTSVPGGYMLYALEESLAEQMKVAEAVMREDRDILRRLAE